MLLRLFLLRTRVLRNSMPPKLGGCVCEVQGQDMVHLLFSVRTGVLHTCMPSDLAVWGCEVREQDMLLRLLLVRPRYCVKTSGA